MIDINPHVSETFGNAYSMLRCELNKIRRLKEEHQNNIDKYIKLTEDEMKVLNSIVELLDMHEREVNKINKLVAEKNMEVY